MKFFIDTANLAEIEDALSLGMLDGVTTNPTLIAKEKVDRDTRIAEICRLVPGPVSAEVLAIEAGAMIKEGKAVAKLASNIVVKIPLTTDGLKATAALAAEGVKVNVTLIFSPVQALMAAKAGAAFASPFVGRLDDIGHDGMDIIEDIITIYDNYGYDTEIIVASIRHPQHVLRAALMGADIATIPHSVISRLAAHPLTDKGLDAFLADYKKSRAK